MASAEERRESPAGGKVASPNLSRNLNALRHTYEAPGGNRTQVDWSMGLRQPRQPLTLKSSATEPSLRCKDQAEARQREPLTSKPAEGPYQTDTETVGRYQNLGNTAHLVRACSQGTLDWQLNLRDGLHRSTGRQQNAGNESHTPAQITPQDRRLDRRTSGLFSVPIRDEPMIWRRSCEGLNLGQWGHLVADSRYGNKSRLQLQQETTLRDCPSDTRHARITDNRSDACIVEMMGKKKWHNATHHDPLAQRGPLGDPKLYHVRNLRTLPEEDETNRQLRIRRHTRIDAEQSETRPPRSSSNAPTSPSSPQEGAGTAPRQSKRPASVSAS